MPETVCRHISFLEAGNYNRVPRIPRLSPGCRTLLAGDGERIPSRSAIMQVILRLFPISWGAIV
jgi:hypothetical protein